MCKHTEHTGSITSPRVARADGSKQMFARWPPRASATPYSGVEGRAPRLISELPRRVLLGNPPSPDPGGAAPCIGPATNAARLASNGRGAPARLTDPSLLGYLRRC